MEVHYRVCAHVYWTAGLEFLSSCQQVSVQNSFVLIYGIIIPLSIIPGRLSEALWFWNKRSLEVNVS